MRRMINILCPYQESDLDLPLRRQPFYPLNYKDKHSVRSRASGAIYPVLRSYLWNKYTSFYVVGDTGFEPAASASRTLRASQLRQSPKFVEEY